MSTNIYIDLIENPIKRWIINFCNLNVNDFDFIGEEYCLIFPEIIEGKKKCVMLSVDIVYPPFDEEFNFIIKNNQYTDNLIMATIHHIRKFYLCVAKTLINDKTNGSDILKNINLSFYKPNYTFAPWPIEIKFIVENLHLYENYFEHKKFPLLENYMRENKTTNNNNKKTDIEGKNKDKNNKIKQEIIKFHRSIINDYMENKIRIGINIEILDNIPPPKGITKELLSNYNSSDSSD